MRPRSILPGLPIVVTGHSLGGALATLLVTDLTANTPLKPQAWTFASPNVGDAAFAARYGALSTVSWRIYNQVDVVPYFPVDIFDHYQPVTTGYAINSLGKAKWNLGCAHARTPTCTCCRPPRCRWTRPAATRPVPATAITRGITGRWRHRSGRQPRPAPTDLLGASPAARAITG